MKSHLQSFSFFSESFWELRSGLHTHSSHILSWATSPITFFCGLITDIGAAFTVELKQMCLIAIFQFKKAKVPSCSNPWQDHSFQDIIPVLTLPHGPLQALKLFLLTGTLESPRPGVANAPAWAKFSGNQWGGTTHWRLVGIFKVCLLVRESCRHAV